MTGKTEAHIAGVGVTSGSGDNALVSAAVKALLDAGVTYDDVTRGVRAKSLKAGSKAFQAFGDEGVSVDEAEDSSALEHAAKLVTEKGEQCVLTIAKDEVDFCMIDHCRSY
jgi:hypothetical protein